MASDYQLARSTSFLLYSIPTDLWTRALEDNGVRRNVRQIEKMSQAELLHAYQFFRRLAGARFEALLQGAATLEESHKLSQSRISAIFAPNLSVDHPWEICKHAPNLSVFQNCNSRRLSRPTRNGTIATSADQYHKNATSVAYIQGNFHASGLRSFRPNPTGLLYAHRGRGPQWTSQHDLNKAPDMSCTTDSIIMALIFLDVGSTWSDHTSLRDIYNLSISSTSTTSSPRSLTAPETYMFQAIATDWLQESKLSKTKALFQRAMLRSRGEWEGLENVYLELSPQMETCFTDVIGQLLVEYTVACKCRRCRADFDVQSAEFFRTGMIAPMEIKFWAQTLQEWFQTINPYHAPISCHCGASGDGLDGIDTRVEHIRVPPRICISPVWIANPYAAIEYFQFDGITFDINIKDIGICCATYRFIGGIYNLFSHFRVFWLDTPIHVRERRWKSYDGKAPQGLEGVILGDIRADHDHCPVPYEYIQSPGALFFECISIIKPS